ncbi:MAG: hypothetical protein NTU49_10910 [Gammaproteobacteria bacterium]|nr:hypothetical protein [Gammaproteobacteria bacterium]
MARPIKLTDKAVEDILLGIGKGLTLKAACKFAGVSYSTLANHMYKGKQAKLKGENTRHTEVLEKINHATRVIRLQHQDRFFFNLSPRSFRYGWRNPMSLEARVKLSEAWKRTQAKRREERRRYFDW